MSCLKNGQTTESKMLTIAMTIISSINVKPFCIVVPLFEVGKVNYIKLPNFVNCFIQVRKNLQTRIVLELLPNVRHLHELFVH